MGRPTVAIVGAGAVGTALGRALRAAGHPIAAIASRSADSARLAAERIGAGRVFGDVPSAARAGDVVLLTVPDRAIESVAEEIAAAGPMPPGILALHTSGYHSSRVLAALAAVGAAVGSLHPLQSFADVDEAVARLPGTRCFWEGDRPETILELIHALGGVPVAIDPDAKPLYHAAAATASNLLVTVIDLALAIAKAGGLDPDEMLAALLPLIEGSVKNVRAVGIPRALTGPIARGDAGTLAGHLEALRRSAPDLLPCFVGLARRTVDLADRRGGLAPEARTAMIDLLKNVDPPHARE